MIKNQLKEASFRVQGASPEEIQRLDDVAKSDAGAAQPAVNTNVQTQLQAEALLRRAADMKDVALLDLAYAKVGQFKGSVNAGDNGLVDEVKDEEADKDDKDDDKDKDKDKDGDKEGEDGDTKKGVDPDAAKDALKKRVKVALITGDTAMHRAAQNDWAQGIHKLVNFEADVEAKNRLESTPLHRACSFGKADAVKALLDKAADVHAKNKIGNTPLHCAVYAGHKHIVKMLLEHGATTDVDAENLVHATPWTYADTIVSRNFLRKLLYRYTRTKLDQALKNKLDDEDHQADEHKDEH